MDSKIYRKLLQINPVRNLQAECSADPLLVRQQADLDSWLGMPVATLRSQVNQYQVGLGFLSHLDKENELKKGKRIKPSNIVTPNTEIIQSKKPKILQKHTRNTIDGSKTQEAESLFGKEDKACTAKETIKAKRKRLQCEAQSMPTEFISAYDKLKQDKLENGGGDDAENDDRSDNDPFRLSGLASKSSNPKFVSPLIENSSNNTSGKRKGSGNSKTRKDLHLKNIDPKMIELITNEIMDSNSVVGWDDICGLSHAKKTIKEIVVFPMLRPDIFSGLRAPPKGLLLFGPPGTGKTLIGKCIASQSKSTFFSISSSSLTSKWVGEGEKMVRALFAVARAHQPSVIFIDEIDSLLSQRTDGENEATRRIKTEFLVQFDGCGTSDQDRILMVGATNRPHEIDEAARRRYI